MRRQATTQILVKKHQRDGTRDRRGNLVETWADPVPVLVFLFVPTASLASPNTVDTGGTVYTTSRTVLAPLDTDIGERDRVIGPDGAEYEVDGVPARWENNQHARSRQNEGLQVQLQRKDG